MFREECPAYIKVSFLWLSLLKMKTFDEVYFNWLQAMKAGSAGELSPMLVQSLITNGLKLTDTDKTYNIPL